jgi:hypothetical protein
LASRLSTIDELTRPDHTFLSADDECYYLGEYTARVGYAYSRTNDLIQNLKKPMDRKGSPEWRWKIDSIETFARDLREAIKPEFLRTATLIPVPPSKRKDDPLYDDRMLQILRLLAGNDQLDIRELVTMKVSIEPAHLHSDRRSVDSLVDVLQVNTELLVPVPTKIAIFDDVLTTGAHYVAMKRVLRQQLAEVPICGIFLARRDPTATDV